MVLFDDIIEIFDAADFDIRFMLRIVAFDRCRVGVALVDRDLLRLAMLADRLTQETQRGFAIPLGGQQKIDCRACLVDGQIEIFPAAFDFHVGLIETPAGPDRALASTELFLQQRRILDDPAVERGVVDFDASLFHHFLELTIAHRIRHISPDAPQDHVAFKMAALEIDHRTIPPAPAPRS